ncbi:MAG: hypothetical protein AB7O98_02285 [Hyphomonadaceae bacterium]
MTEAQAATTRFCARVIGPLMLIIGAIVIVRFNDIVLMMPAIVSDAPLAFITGIFTLIVGCILFAAHHHWNGGATAILISVLGVLTIARGVLLMLAPNMIASFANQALTAGPAPWIAGAVAVLIGAWLTYAGWFAKAAA